jgi:hypothetical protein
METHFKGPRGHYRCVHDSTLLNGWIVQEIIGDKIHVLSINMTREDAFMHAKGMSGLPDRPDIVVVDEPMPDRRGLVAHSRKMA